MSVAETEDKYVPLSTPEADPWALNLEDIDMSNGQLFQEGAHHEYFKRLRKEAPVHRYEKNPFVGPFWSITRYSDIVAIETNHKVFSSEPSIALVDSPFLTEESVPAFISMDPPLHDQQRKAVTPAVNPLRLSQLDTLIRERTEEVLDNLPAGEVFNWVDLVSVELTTRMLATLFDYPFDNRQQLTFWSDVSTTPPSQMGMSKHDRIAHLLDCLQTFRKLFSERQFEGNESQDFISLLANNPDTRDMGDMELMGNLMLLIVGGNDTTRNSMSGGIWFMHQFPEQFSKLKNNPDLIPSAVSEIIRYHTPLSYMRRTALEDVDINGKTIRKGDKVVLWYASANRDDLEINRPDEFIIDRPQVRHHASFGYGIHRCLGNRVAESQLRILWEEILKRFERIEVVGSPERLDHSFVHGIKTLNVILHPRT